MSPSGTKTKHNRFQPIFLFYQILFALGLLKKMLGLPLYHILLKYL